MAKSLEYQKFFFEYLTKLDPTTLSAFKTGSSKVGNNIVDNMEQQFKDLDTFLMTKIENFGEQTWKEQIYEEGNFKRAEHDPIDLSSYLIHTIDEGSKDLQLHQLFGIFLAKYSDGHYDLPARIIEELFKKQFEGHLARFRSLVNDVAKKVEFSKQDIDNFINQLLEIGEEWKKANQTVGNKRARSETKSHVRDMIDKFTF